MKAREGERASSEPTEPSATSYELKQLAFAVLLSELVIAALTIATRAFFGVRPAVWVGVGIGILVFLAFALIALFGSHPQGRGVPGAAGDARSVERGVT